MANVQDVARYIVESAGPISTMKLQKLVYYAQAWNLVWLEAPLFDAEIQAWLNGPVVFELYDKHRGRFNIDSWPDGDVDRLTEDEIKTLDAVLDAYGKYTGQQLSALSHQEDPWVEARGDLPSSASSSAPINLDHMQQYYSAVAEASDSVDL
jgi:uncharacterized phage-associated protein